MSDLPSANLADYVSEAARRRPGHPALVVGATRLTWADVDSAVDAAATGFRHSGLTEGDRVGLVLGNRPEFVFAYFGALRAGLVSVPLNPGFTAPEIGQLLRHASASAVVADRESAAAVRQAELPGALRVMVGPALADEVPFDELLTQGRRESFAASSRGGDDLAVLLYTSGTSGDPKGAMLTHRALCSSIEHVAALSSPIVAPEDVVLVVLPLAHVYSLNGTLGAVVRQAATAVLTDRFDVEGTLRLVQEHAVTNIPGAPAMWAPWSDRDDLNEALAGVRLLFSGSAALPPEVQERLHAKTGLVIHEGYGLTEAAPGVCSTLVTGVVKPGSVGQPFPGVEIRLTDEDGGEIDQEDGDPGEVWIRGDNLFSGYWPDGVDGPNPDGWYATGDVAYLDSDGDLHLVDRRKELIIVNGFNVYPREVEEVLELHPGVAEAAVVGVPLSAGGEAVKAYVVSRPDADLALDELVTFCAQRLARFKRPHELVLVEALPHSMIGKIVKSRIGRHE